MTKLAVVLLALLCGCSSGARAAYFDDNGNKYFGRCAKESPDIVCYATASSFLDMMMALGYQCKKDAGVTRHQVTDILIKYLRDHPADRDDVLAFSAIVAFQESLGCTQTPPKPRG
jgi:hypothetical protein